MAMIDSVPEVRGHPFRPTADYERWRAEHPLKRVRLKNGQEPWIVLRQAEAQAILDQTDSLTSDATAVGFPAFREGAPSGSASTQMVRMDPPLHSKFRKIFAGFFTARRIDGWKPQIQRFVDEGLERLQASGPPADFFKDFALTVPSKAICLLMGVDYAWHADFERLTRPVASALVSAEVRNTAIRELHELIAQMFADQRANPRDGVLAKLITLIDAGEITEEAAVSNAFLILIGGHETTAHTIALGTMQVLERPDLKRAILDDPGKVPILIEEMVRTQSVAEGVMTRAVVKPIQVGEVTIQPGEGLAVPASSANHDPSAFPNPDEIDLDRDLSGGHIAFGWGIHSCLGQSLARAELISVFSTLFQRIPTLRLAEHEEIEFQRDPFVFGVNRMPVEW
jgi:cytochrome P450